MSKFDPEDILTCALTGHGTVGKTILADAMLFNAGEVNRIGSIESGSTVSDYHEDEIERQISINSSVLNFSWQEKKINLLDTPGYADFFGEVQGALRGADFSLVLISGVAGIEVGTEQVWQAAADYGLPRLLAVNMLDRENTKFDDILALARERFGARVFPLGWPVNPGPNFNQVADVLRKELHTYKTDGSGKYDAGELPADWSDRINTFHGELIELVAESDDTLLEKYFDQDALSEDDLRGGLRGAILAGTLIPLFPMAGLGNIGVRRMMDLLAKYAPCAADAGEVKGMAGAGSDQEVSISASKDGSTSIFIFKTVSEANLGELSFFRVYSGTVKTGVDLLNSSQQARERMGTIYTMNGKKRNELGTVVPGDIAAVVKLKHSHTGDTLCDPHKTVVLPRITLPEHKERAAIMPRSKGDEDKISTGLATLHEEDPTFVFEFDPELRQTIISGQGELHLETVVRRLKQRFGVDVELAEPKVPYRETISSRGESKYRHKKQTGCSGQFAEVWMFVEPLPPGSGIKFESQIKGMAIDRVFIPSIEKGVMAAVSDGVLAGYRCVDAKAVVYDGKQHPVDSKDIAFQTAGREAFKEAFRQAKPALLEPIYEIEVLVPEEFMGDIMGDISSRRGKVLGMETEGHLQKVKAHVPLGSLGHYATALRSMTGGRGLHTQHFFSYERMPHDEEKRVIKATKSDKAE